MTFEVIEELRFYLRGKVREDRISADNSRLNGYKEIALRHENEAALGDYLLKELSMEHGALDASKRNSSGL